MGYGSPVDSDAKVAAEVDELPPGELSSLVGDDGVRYPKPMDNTKDELGRFLGANFCDQPGFNPLCELVDGDEQVSTAPGCFF